MENGDGFTNSEVEEVKGGIRFAARLMAGVGVVVISTALIGGFVEWKRISDQLHSGPLVWAKQSQLIELRLASIEHLLKDLKEDHERLTLEDQRLQRGVDRLEDSEFGPGNPKPPLTHYPYARE